MKFRSMQHAIAVAACLSVCAYNPAFAASHRNGPLLLEDQTANLNDFYIFRSYETRQVGQSCDEHERSGLPEPR